MKGGFVLENNKEQKLLEKLKEKKDKGVMSSEKYRIVSALIGSKDKAKIEAVQNYLKAL